MVHKMIKRVDGSCTAGIVVWSIVFGVALRQRGEHRSSLVEMIGAIGGTAKIGVQEVIRYGERKFSVKYRYSLQKFTKSRSFPAENVSIICQFVVSFPGFCRLERCS